MHGIHYNNENSKAEQSECQGSPITQLKKTNEAMANDILNPNKRIDGTVKLLLLDEHPGP
jgi:hypothetical protein